MTLLFYFDMACPEINIDSLWQMGHILYLEEVVISEKEVVVFLHCCIWFFLCVLKKVTSMLLLILAFLFGLGFLNWSSEVCSIVYSFFFKETQFCCQKYINKARKKTIIDFAFHSCQCVEFSILLFLPK